MPSKTVKLSTNIPLIGVVSKVFFHHTQKAIDEGWTPQLKLVGVWDGEGEANVYVPLRLAEDMHKAGFMTIETGPDHDLYHVMVPNTRIKLIKEEDGTKKFITFSIADHLDRPSDGLPPEKETQAPQDAPEAKERARTTPKPKSKLKSVVGDVKRFHLGCMALSAHNHVLLYTCGVESLDMNAVHAGGFTIMKKLEEQGVTSFTEKQLKSIKDTLSDASYEARKMSEPSIKELPDQTFRRERGETSNA